MNDTDRQKPRENTEDVNPPGEIISKYEVVPYAEIAKDDDLYSFRAALATPQPVKGKQSTQQKQLDQQIQQQLLQHLQLPQQASDQVQALPQQEPLSRQKKLALMGGMAALILVFVILLVVVLSMRPDSAPPFIDLGPNNLAAAGLSARLIAKWDGKAEYELHIDAVSPQQIPGFSAVAANPPRPLWVNIQMKDSSGSPLCQKEILFPFNAAAAADPEQVQPLLPQKTFDGDTVQNVAASNGDIAEIVVYGQLLCPVKLYKRLVSWDFSSSFPSIAEQQDWMHHEEGVTATLRRNAAQARARALIPRTHTLPSPIDGDDVIVSDNPSRGTFETRAGRLFYIGMDSLRSGASGWQVFPATIHFHCDTKGMCVLSRANTSTALQARLVH
jgi:hypothetical protein